VAQNKIRNNQSSVAPEADSIPALKRFASDQASVQAAAGRVAMNIEEAWRLGKAASVGPIDVVDMFAGCGGMSAGFVAANSLMPMYRLAMAVDIDPHAMATYEKNLGLAPQNIDLHEYASDQTGIVRLIDQSRSGRRNPWVLIGCAPCQGFSSHRNSAGATDHRNSLFVTFARIAAAAQPDVVVIENVPEVVTDKYWPTVVEARKSLQSAGYETLLLAHDLSAFGVPQHRYRAVMIAMKRRFVGPVGFLDGKRRKTVRDAIGGLPAILPGQRSADDPMHYTAGHRASTVETIMAVKPDGGSRPSHVGPESLRRFAIEHGKSAYEDVYGRLWWDKPAITITGHARNPASGRYVHPEQHRGLSVREAALLQSFPPAWEFVGGLGKSFLQIGNAVPPAFAAHLAIHIVGQLFGTGESQEDPADIRTSVGPSFSRLIPAIKAGYRSLPTSLTKVARNA
jgi:DNA (cytosine-5)-methyltransferase 1